MVEIFGTTVKCISSKAMFSSSLSTYYHLPFMVYLLRFLQVCSIKSPVSNITLDTASHEGILLENGTTLYLKDSAYFCFLLQCYAKFGDVIYTLTRFFRDGGSHSPAKLKVAEHESIG